MSKEKIDWVSFVAGVSMAASFFVLVSLPSLRGPFVTTFLTCYLIAGGAYAAAILRLSNDKLPLKYIWGFAILFRLILLFTSPTLSDDVYRYLWDGHLLNAGVSPYALPVNSPLLDKFDTPLRSLVNHNWMASPYLPVTQLVFAIVSRLVPQSMLAFQVTATTFDLLTGWVVMDLLKLLGLPRSRVLLYLWNPLVIVEFAHGAHMDSLMLFFIMAAFWIIAQSQAKKEKYAYGSVLALALATLTKYLPILLAPLFFRRWGWKGMLLFISLILGIISLFSIGAGWGLTGPLNGTGVFGATRIYLQYWNYNSSLYHWLEVSFSGYQTPGPVPIEIVGKTPILLAKAITTGGLGVAVLISFWLAWRNKSDCLTLIRISMIPLGAYLLLTATVHPWYVTLNIPFLPFFTPQKNDQIKYQVYILPWIYFSISVASSYFTYVDPENLREYGWVRLVEYIPLYLLLIWAAWFQIRQHKAVSSLKF